MQLSKEDAREILWSGDPAVKVIDDNIIESTRWSIIHEIVFSWTDENFYRTTYSVGATESQDESPFEYDDIVECEQVHQVEKTVTVWEAVDANT